MTTLEQPGSLEQHDNLVKMHQPETAKNIHVFVNGDRHFAGRKFVVNRRHICDFDGFLNQVTMGIKAPFGAVRNVYTPTVGHRVNELTQIQNGMNLVAGGVERFRRIDYMEIGQKKRMAPRRNYLDFKLHHQRMNVSARWRKYVKDPCQIYVYGNGDVNAPALRLLLIPRCMKTWDLVLGEITEKISLRTGQAVRKLYDMNYRLLEDPSDLENGHYYIAVGTEKIKKFPYGEMNVNKMHHSPRRSNQPLPPIKKTRKPKPPAHEDEDKTYAKMYAQRKYQREQEETTVMGASAATGYRPLRTKKYKPQRPSGEAPKHEGETVFHAKPVKVKRSGGRAPQLSHEHPPSADSDGVFRANSSHIKAEEVDEDEDTKVDLPIDQVPADAVDEENIQVVTSNDDVTADDAPQDVSVNLGSGEEHRDVDEVVEEHVTPAPSAVAQSHPDITDPEEDHEDKSDGIPIEDASSVGRAESPQLETAKETDDVGGVVNDDVIVMVDESSKENVEGIEPHLAGVEEDNNEVPENDVEEAEDDVEEAEVTNSEIVDDVEARNAIVDDPIATDEIHPANDATATEADNSFPANDEEADVRKSPNQDDLHAVDEAERLEQPSPEDGAEESETKNNVPVIDVNDEKIREKEEVEDAVLNSVSLEDETTVERESVTPSSPKPNDAEAQSAGTVEDKDHRRSEADGADVPPHDDGVPPNDDGVPPNDDDVSPQGDGVPPHDGGVPLHDDMSPHDQVSIKDEAADNADDLNVEDSITSGNGGTARPASDALTVDDDQHNATTPSSKQSIPNGNATGLNEIES